MQLAVSYLRRNHYAPWFNYKYFLDFGKGVVAGFTLRSHRLESLGHHHFAWRIL